jgi:hypothetical protein
MCKFESFLPHEHSKTLRSTENRVDFLLIGSELFAMRLSCFECGIKNKCSQKTACTLNEVKGSEDTPKTVMFRLFFFHSRASLLVNANSNGHEMRLRLPAEEEGKLDVVELAAAYVHGILQAILDSSI